MLRLRPISTAETGRSSAEFTEVETGKRSDRPELDKALAAARLHRRPLVVSKVDRLTRSVAFLSDCLRLALTSGLRTAADRRRDRAFMLQQMVAVAELEAGMISAHQGRARAAKRRGKKLGGDRGVKPSTKTRAKALAAIEQRASARAADLRRRSRSYRRAALSHCGPSQPGSTIAASRPRAATASGLRCRWRACSPGRPDKISPRL